MTYNQLEEFCTGVHLKYIEAGIVYDSIPLVLKEKEFYETLMNVCEVSPLDDRSYAVNLTLLNGIKVKLIKEFRK